MTITSHETVALESAVDHSRDVQMAAVNAGDIAASASRFTADGVFLPPGTPALKGILAISSQHRRPPSHRHGSRRHLRGMGA